MTKEEIMRLARDAWLLDKVDCSDDWFLCGDADVDEVLKFADLVIAAEREACAKVCEDEILAWSYPGSITRSECAAAIRRRGEAKP